MTEIKEKKVKKKSKWMDGFIISKRKTASELYAAERIAIIRDKYNRHGNANGNVIR